MMASDKIPSMRRHVAQPPIDPASRDPEQHEFWPGFVFAVLGLLLAACGVTHLTAINTQAGDSGSELQLIKAFSSGGLEYVQPAPPRAAPDDPAAAAAELDRYEAQQAAHPARKLRINTGASTPCPT